MSLNGTFQRLKPHKMKLKEEQNLKLTAKLTKRIGGFNPLETVVMWSPFLFSFVLSFSLLPH
jgi:hypothetical protein